MVLNWIVGFLSVAVFGVPPPPKLHDHVVGIPVERSVKSTVPPACTVVLFEVKSTVGLAVGSQPVELSRLLLVLVRTEFMYAACSTENIF